MLSAICTKCAAKRKHAINRIVNMNNIRLKILEKPKESIRECPITNHADTQLPSVSPVNREVMVIWKFRLNEIRVKREGSHNMTGI